MTEARFKTAPNAEIIDHIRKANPFAHSDLGERLIALQKQLGTGSVFCPSYPSCAFVVLHDQANTVFAFAGGMREISFLLPPALRDELLRQGAVMVSRIGPSWIDVAAFSPDAMSQLESCCASAFAHTADRTAAPRN